MRFDGLLTSWNEATASGVITPGKGGDDIIVHASEFPQDGPAPAVGEAVSFGVELGPGGIKHAHSISRPRVSSRVAVKHQQARSSSSMFTAALVVLTATAALYYASMRHQGGQPVPAPAPVAAEAAAAALRAHRTDLVAASRFARPAPPGCDGRTRCSQMKSCAEATYFQEQCPGAEMDGDRDGIPCETQWCKPAQAALPPGP
ncbi:excalibur calcium-binding domain-containing protein [Massilia sp. GCM10020059]|uniref:Excalibur calcium-binding domain-containing protein n=1 Tax=Massilia agrisoli TaxID=2892444 RepID=A0ABS8IUA0_9BURK|nr:excalibur calcium-binding domain-containing protein [Massilia agrisoli]MCC6072000.1 excalibur calcium-binding domain-containing protein [Massilia agrisoli]